MRDALSWLTTCQAPKLDIQMMLYVKTLRALSS